MQGGRVVSRAQQLLHIWSHQWQAVIHLTIITFTEWVQIAQGCRGMLVQAGEENGWKLSVEKECGTWGYSWRKLTHLQVLRSSVPLQSPGEKKRGRALGAGLLSVKESEPRAQRGETHVTTVVTFCPGECCFSVGGIQAWNTLAVFVSGVQESPARVTKTKWHLQQRRRN